MGGSGGGGVGVGEEDFDFENMDENADSRDELCKYMRGRLCGFSSVGRV